MLYHIQVSVMKSRSDNLPFILVLYNSSYVLLIYKEAVLTGQPLYKLKYADFSVAPQLADLRVRLICQIFKVSAHPDKIFILYLLKSNCCNGMCRHDIYRILLLMAEYHFLLHISRIRHDCNDRIIRIAECTGI